MRKRAMNGIQENASRSLFPIKLSSIKHTRTEESMMSTHSCAFHISPAKLLTKKKNAMIQTDYLLTEKHISETRAMNRLMDDLDLKENQTFQRKSPLPSVIFLMKP